MTPVSCVLLLVAIVLAAAEDISPSTEDAADTGNSSLDSAHDPDVSNSTPSNESDLIGADAERGGFSVPRFYNLTVPLKRGASVKDIAKLVTADGEDEGGTTIVRRKRTYFKKKCHKCGGGGGGGGWGHGGGGGFQMPSPIIIQVIKQPKGGGCHGGGCGGGGYQQNPCGHGGCYQPPPQQHPVGYCDRCQQQHGGGGQPWGGSGSFSQSSAQSSAQSYSWGKK